jgi:ABC-2 type transport system permease protein
MVTRHIIVNEVLRLFRDRLALASSALLIVLLATSIANGVLYFQQLAAQQGEAEQLSRQQWEQQSAKNPHSAAHYGTWAFMPVHGLMIFEPGITRYTGVSLFLEGHRQNIADQSLAEDMDASLRFAELTPAFIFTYLFPLLIIFVGFRMMSAEKESGMFRFLLAQGVHPWQLISGKAIALLTLTAVLFLPFLFAGLFVTQATSESIGDTLRFLGLCAIWGIYFIIFIQLTIGVSSLVRHSGTALVILLGIWMMVVLMFPRLVTLITTHTDPVPSTSSFYQAISADLQQGVDGHNPFSVYSVTFRDSVLQSHGVDEVSQLPFNFRGMLLQEAEEFEKRIYDLHRNRIDEIHDRQLQQFAFGAFFSPTIALRTASMNLAGTNLDAYRHFLYEAEAYRVDLMRILNHDLRDNAVGDRATGYVVGESFFSQNPLFVYERPEQLALDDGFGSSLLALLVWIFATTLWLGLIARIKENS